MAIKRHRATVCILTTTMFPYRNRLRHLAARVLVVWLLALATGFVNACVVNPALHTRIVPALDQHEDRAANAGPADDHAGQPCGSAHDPTPACSKFCSEPSTAAQDPKHPMDPADAVWLAMPIVAPLSVAPSPTAARVPGRDPERWRPAASIPIFFLRLTL